MDSGFVDCHCHISATEFQQDLQDVIHRTRQAGVKTLVAVTEGVEEFSRVLRLQQSYPDLVAPCLGLHPLQAGASPGRRSVKPQDLDAALPHFYSHRDRLVAIGEVGLDFTPWCAPTQQDRDDQLRVFIRQLDVALELDLPVNVHSRSAAQVTIDTMRQRGISRALLQLCCTTSLGNRQQLWKRDKLIRQLPLEHVCLETDAPALGLHRHERSEPANVALSCSYIAKVKGQPPETVRLVTTQNAYRLFSRASR